MKALLFTLLRSFEFTMALPAESIEKRSVIVARPYVKNNTASGAQMPLVVRVYKEGGDRLMQQTDSAGRSRANLNSDFDDFKFQEVDSVHSISHTSPQLFEALDTGYTFFVSYASWTTIIAYDCGPCSSVALLV